MRLERVIIRGLRALRDRDDSFVDAQQTPLTRVCLRGINGSGKTTYLEAIAELWQWFRRCTKSDRYADFKKLKLGGAQLVAGLFTDLPGPRQRMWIAAGRREELSRLPSGPENPYTLSGNAVMWDRSVLEHWRRAFEGAESGMSRDELPPNIVYIPAEEKYVPVLTSEQLQNPKPTAPFYPVARYLPTARGASHLEPLIRTLRLAREDSWKELAGLIKTLRPGLTLLDRFDEATQRPLFQLATKEILTVHDLSAGERSLLINLCMVLRWLSPKGILLLDEPELHQHLSLMRSSLAAIHDFVAEDLGGQVVVASHAPEVWDYFHAPNSLIDLGATS